MSESDQPASLEIYSDSAVVAQYAALDHVTDCERLLFETYLLPGIDILDLGVGGGRTTPFLSGLASHYVGVDYAEGMVRVCREKFPQLRFEVADAANLSCFADGSFDAVVFSYNGLDNLVPEQKRRQCLQECHRVLKPGGVLIFSSHNPRALFVNWQWDRERLRRLANKFSGGRRPLYYPALTALTSGRIGLAVLRTVAAAIPRAFRRLPTKTFWRGQGYLLDPTHGGMLMYYALPSFVTAELASLQFERLRELPENYPQKSNQYCTRWFYYVFAKVNASEASVRVCA